MMNESKNGIIRISNKLNLTTQNYSILEKRILICALYVVKNQQGINLEGKDVNLNIIIDTNLISEKDIKRINEALKRLVSKRIKYYKKESDSEERFGYIIPFTSAFYNSRERVGSSIELQINSLCKAMFLELANGYTQTDLRVALSLNSIYSIRLYELFSMYIRKGEWDIDIELLKEYIGAKSVRLKNFSTFEKDVLLYAQNELYEKANISIIWQISEKVGRKITKIKFTIKDNEEVSKINLKEEILYTQNYINALSPQQIRDKVLTVLERYALNKQQQEYIVSRTEVFNEFIRIDLIIENKITKGHPPKDRTKYLAKALGLDKIKFTYNTEEKKSKQQKIKF